MVDYTIVERIRIITRFGLGDDDRTSTIDCFALSVKEPSDGSIGLRIGIT